MPRWSNEQAEGIVRGGVDEGGVAVAVAGAGFPQQVGAVGHGLHATRDDGVELAVADQLIGHGDRVQPGKATLLTVRAGTFMGMPPLTAACRAVICPAPAWMT